MSINNLNKSNKVKGIKFKQLDIIDKSNANGIVCVCGYDFNFIIFKGNGKKSIKILDTEDSTLEKWTRIYISELLYTEVLQKM